MYQSSKEEEFLKKHFSDYYKKHLIDSVSEIETREFGYGVYKRKIANRNISFLNKEELNKFLIEKAPLFVSYSNSYYKFPSSSPMNTKGWLKSDIIYEFDADEIFAETELVNGRWVCKKTFGGSAFIKETGEEKKQWFLEKSLEEAKKQVFRLVDVLVNDFGFKEEWIKINFSGKAGYHVHLRNKEIWYLNKKSRIELVDYLTGHGIYFDNIGYDFESLKISKLKGNWNNRIDQGLIEFFEKDVIEISKITKLPKPKVKQLVKSKQEILTSFKHGLLYDVGARTNKVFWKSVFDFIISTYLIPIDRQTSVDLHKIIRVPNTLHGDTGFIAKELTVKEFKNFNPFIDAVVFGDELIDVMIEEAPKFSLKGVEFGPFVKETVKVPLYCAIFLIGKGAKLG